MDPNGDSTFVTANEDGTYKVERGTIDDHNGIYLLGENESKELIAYSASPLSFYNPGSKEFQGNIDPSDQTGRTFMKRLLVDYNPNYFIYGNNATKNEIFDFKRTNGQKPDTYTKTSEFYRGMPVFNKYKGMPVYASARDVGNIAAGMIAGKEGMSWSKFRSVADGLESAQGTWQAKKLVIRKEDIQSQLPQRLGWKLGIYLSLPKEKRSVENLSPIINTNNL